MKEIDFTTSQLQIEIIPITQEIINKKKMLVGS